MSSKENKIPRCTSRIQAFLLILFSVTSALVVLEIILRIVGYGDPMKRVDPFFGFDGTNPIFIKEKLPSGEFYYVPASNKSYIKQTFPVTKSTTTYRIFAFGGSTTEGSPWGFNGSFPYYLSVYLKRLYPVTDIEVINLGISGRGSTRALTIMKEVVEYKPDLFVIYTGQNEFRDSKFHAREIKRSPLISQIMKQLFESRAIFFLYEKSLILQARIFGKRITSFGAQRIKRTLLEPFTNNTFKSYDYYRVPEVHDAKILAGSNTPRPRIISNTNYTRAGFQEKLGSRIGGIDYLKNVLEDDKITREETFGIFADNIREMIDLSQSNGINIIFLAKARNPKAMNLLNSKEYDINSSYLRDGSESNWKNHYHYAIKNFKKGHFRDALDLFLRVRSQLRTEYQDSDMLLNLYLGECYEKLGRYDQAKLEYNKRTGANHIRLNVILKEITNLFDVPVVDVQSLLEQSSENGIVGYNFFVDRVHMQREAYQLIAAELAELIRVRGNIQNFAKNNLLDRSELIVKSFKEDVPTQQVHRPIGLTSLGWSAFHQGKFDEALLQGKKAVQINPDDVQAHLLLGYVYSKKQDYKNARIEWETLKEFWRNN